MAYDEILALRVRTLLDSEDFLVEKRMFGGYALMLRGNMACGVIKDELVVRVGPEAYDEALGEPGARPFDFTGRPMRGWVAVSPDVISDDAALRRWVRRGVGFVRELPGK